MSAPQSSEEPPNTATRFRPRLKKFARARRHSTRPIMRNSRQFAYSQGKVKLRPMSRVNVHVFMSDGNAFNIDASTGFIPLIAEFGEVR